MTDRGYVLRRLYYIQAADGYICIEQASCPSEALRKAASRPGYGAGARCREQLQQERESGYMPHLWNEIEVTYA